MMVFLRSGTNDGLIREGIYQRNEYKLPPTFASSDLVVDIGAHIGFFALAALERGAGTVYAVEAHSENYQLAARHLETYIREGRVDLRWGAVWRSDEARAFLTHSGFKRGFDHPHPGIEVNTGAGTVLFAQGGEEVPVIAFDALMGEATQQGTRRVRLLKMDCEGSEWPILFTSHTLDLVDEIVGEYHEIGGPYDSLDPRLLALPGAARCTVEALETFLRERHFTFSHTRATQNDGSPARRGLFFAQHIANQPSEPRPGAGL